MAMPGRSYEARDYRFGFNGKEEDDEVKGVGNSLDFGSRVYDPRSGRWLSRDSKESELPGISTYHFALNNPLSFDDPNGRSPRGKILIYNPVTEHALLLNHPGGERAKSLIILADDNTMSRFANGGFFDGNFNQQSGRVRVPKNRRSALNSEIFNAITNGNNVAIDASSRRTGLRNVIERLNVLANMRWSPIIGQLLGKRGKTCQERSNFLSGLASWGSVRVICTQNPTLPQSSLTQDEGI